MKSSIWLTMTHPIFLHSLALPGQSKKKKKEKEENWDAKKTPEYSIVGCLYSPIKMILSREEQKITGLYIITFDFLWNINAKQGMQKTVKMLHVSYLIRSSKQKTLLCCSIWEIPNALLSVRLLHRRKSLKSVIWVCFVQYSLCF